MKLNLITILICSIFLTAGTATAAEKKNKKSSKQKTDEVTPRTSDGPKVQDDVVAKSSTRIDFSETSIDGQMKAPEGFFLQGRNTNSLSQMVKLRSNFRNELRNSSSAVKSHVR